jgi:5S rRNA maturation endonuclease (ribonuclease M5)
MNEPDLRSLLVSLGLQRVRRIGNNLQACCPNPEHLEQRPSWGIAISEPHMHGCFSCGYKGSLRSLLSKRFQWSDLKIEQVAGIESAAKGAFFGSFNHATLSYERDTALSDDHQLDFSMRMMEPRGLAYAASRGLTLRTILDCGLKYHRQDRRVLFPWFDGASLLGATGRTVEDHPDKIKSYYGLAKGKHLYMPTGSLQKAPLVLVEGEIDALTVYQAGFKNVAALGHGRISEDAISSALNFFPTEAVLFFDSDNAGRRLMQDATTFFKGRLPVRLVDYRVVFPKARSLKVDPGSLTPRQIRRLVNTAVAPSPWTNFELASPI